MCACGGSGGTNERRVHDMRGAHEIRHARLAALRLDCGRPHGSRSHGPRSVGGVHRPGDKATPATAEGQTQRAEAQICRAGPSKYGVLTYSRAVPHVGPKHVFSRFQSPTIIINGAVCATWTFAPPPPPKKRPRGTQLHQSEPGLDPAPSAWASWVVPGRDYYSRNTP